MKLTDFKYDLPDEMVAQYPSDKRGTSRLMVLNRETEEIKHDNFPNIGEYIKEGDAVAQLCRIPVTKLLLLIL